MHPTIKRVVLFGGVGLIAVALTKAALLPPSPTDTALPRPAGATQGLAGSNPSGAGPGSTSARRARQVSTGAPQPQPAEAMPASGTVASASRLDYAVAVTELQGLPRDAAPGTRLELWVAWDPPITKRPKYQKLFDDVILDKIVPAATPQGPDAAILSVRRSDIPDLLYSDRYGALAVAVVP